MKQKLFYLLGINNRGSFLPYVLFIHVLALNIFIFTLSIYLNEQNTYNDKLNYYQIFILEERAKRHVFNKMKSNTALNGEIERIYYGEDLIYLYYRENKLDNYWVVDVTISHNKIESSAYIYYYINDELLTFIYR